VLEVAAEQIAWRKGKSPRVGRRLRVSPEMRALLLDGEVHGFERVGGRWRPTSEGGATVLAEALDYNEGDDDGMREGA